jgi:hypothetical protein
MKLSSRKPRAEPTVRRDGLCRTCKGERHPERSRKYGKAVAELDPFCSTECAKAWYRTETHFGKPVS